MIWRIKRLFSKIRKLVRWIPVIWNDYEWDHCYFLQILSFKLKLMEEFYKSDKAISVDSKKLAKDMRICWLLCERLINGHYLNMLDMQYHQTNFENFIAALNKGEATITSHTVSWTFNRWMKYEDYMRKQDLDYLCKLLQKHLFSWWD